MVLEYGPTGCRRGFVCRWPARRTPGRPEGTLIAQHILLVDDDDLLRRGLAFDLEKAGYRVTRAASAEDGLALAVADRPDLVLLDIGLPGISGLKAFRQFEACCALPVIFLTARGGAADEIAAMDLGAYDYVTKPFNTAVLLSHVRSALRRAEQSPLLSVGDLVIDLGCRAVYRRGQPVELRQRTFDVLCALATHPNGVIALDDLLNRVWGAESGVEPQVVYVHVRWLREKLEDEPSRPRRIVTVPGQGYKLVPQEM